jgi:hypothetical protein
MPSTIRPFHLFPVCCPVTYHAGLFEGRGTIWNLSLNGWRLSGDLPLRVGETCSFTIHLPNHQSIYGAAAIVRGCEGQESGLESLLLERHTPARLHHYVKRLIRDSAKIVG